MTSRKTIYLFTEGSKQDHTELMRARPQAEIGLALEACKDVLTYFITRSLLQNSCITTIIFGSLLKSSLDNNVCAIFIRLDDAMISGND